MHSMLWFKLYISDLLLLNIYLCDDSVCWFM